MFLCIECGKNLDENSFNKKVKNRCKNCLNKNFKCKLCGKFFSKKWLPTDIEREHAGFPNSLLSKHPQNKSNSNKLEKAYRNNRTLIERASSSGKTYLVFKVLSRIPDRDIYIITKSPLEQYSNTKLKIKEIGEEIKPLNEYQKAIIVFDDILGSSNSRYIDQFFIGGRHNNLHKHYQSQSYFSLPTKL